MVWATSFIVNLVKDLDRYLVLILPSSPMFIVENGACLDTDDAIGSNGEHVRRWLVTGQLFKLIAKLVPIRLDHEHIQIRFSLPNTYTSAFQERRGRRGASGGQWMMAWQIDGASRLRIFCH